MKIIPFLLLLISFNLLHSQTIFGLVKDSVSQNPIPFSNIVLKNGKGTYSSEFGLFELGVQDLKHDTLKVSSMGYKDKIVLLKDHKTGSPLEVLLQPKIEALDEVLITNKQIKYTDKVAIGVKKTSNIGYMTIVGHETAILFKNPKRIKGKLKRVYIELKKRRDADYIATLNFKFYVFDRINKRPGKLIYNENLYVKPKNTKYRLWIDTKDLDIEFPENGICIGVEMVNTHGSVEKHANFGPMFRNTLDENDSFKTWSNYHNSEWKMKAGKRSYYKKTKSGIAVPLMGIEVLYPEK